MKRFWFKVLLIVCCTGLLVIGSGSLMVQPAVVAQQLTAPPSDMFITVTYEEQINVRNGPSTVLYEIIGYLQPGDTAPALGVSPGQDWIKISFPSGPGGVGWVYISLVTLSPGTLQVVEPPPTSTPLTTPTIDPTLAAAFVFVPTSTRLPTFTPAPEITLPQFTEVVQPEKTSRFPMGVLVFGLGVPGLLGYIFSTIRKR